MYPYLRPPPDKTLTDVMNILEARPGTSVRAINTNVSVALLDREEDARTITINNPGGVIEVPATQTSLEALGGWVGIPKSFLMRQGTELQQYMLNYLLAHQADEGIFRVSSDYGLLEVRAPEQKVIEPRSIVEVLMRSIDKEAEVVDFWSTPDDFRLDTIVPADFDRGIGGDPQVGDITRGGVRVMQNRKQNHAPQVSEFMYRLECTNGMEAVHTDLHIDARGETVEDILIAIEAAAQRVMGRIEQRIEHFYALRAEMVPDASQMLDRIAKEEGISDRVLGDLIDILPEIKDEDGSVSLFALVNLVTNFANEGSIDRRAGARRVLELAGGSVVVDAADRCLYCQSRLRS